MVKRTHGSFRAIRESLGVSQNDVAEALNVRERSVRRWESTGGQMPPEDAWEYLNAMRRRFASGVDEAVWAAEDSGAKRASITYYRSQEEYNAMGRDDGPYGLANAISRQVMLLLEARGFEVSLLFPEEADAPLVRAVMETR